MIKRGKGYVNANLTKYFLFGRESGIMILITYNLLGLHKPSSLLIMKEMIFAVLINLARAGFVQIQVKQCFQFITS